MKIGKIIKRIRSEKDMSQGDLAKACTITQAYLSQVENNLKMPSSNLMQTIANVLGVPVSVLFYLAIEEKDIPANKRKAFSQLSPTIRSLVESVFL